tara:strand:- start:874 stop:1758 length:885 start_codon:yes stop_codon:yes gene_type:complete
VNIAFYRKKKQPSDPLSIVYNKIVETQVRSKNQLQTDLVIVLKAVRYQERNQIITGLSQHNGLISAITKNSIQSRRFGGTLEPFVASEWTYLAKPGRDLWRLDQTSLRSEFKGIRTSFEKLSLASVFNEIILKIAQPEQPTPQLFQLHANALDLVEKTELDSQTLLVILNAYLAKILHWSGTQPSLTCCKNCQTSLTEIQGNVLCLVEDAGWLCQNCRSTEMHIKERNFVHSIEPIALADFMFYLSHPIKQSIHLFQSSKAGQEQILGFLKRLLGYHIPGFNEELKSFRFLNFS